MANLRTKMGGDNVDEINAKLDVTNKIDSNFGQNMVGGSGGGGKSKGSQGGD